MEWRMKRYPKKRSRLGSIPGPCVHARCLLTLPVDDTPSASSIRPSFLFHVGAKGDGREWRTECCGQKKKEEEEDEEEKRRLSGEREQSVFSESGWRAYTYIEVVLRVADIHTWRATWSYSFCFVLFSLARAARQRRRRKERTCKKKVRSSQSNSAFTVDAASLKRARRSCSVKSLVILALGAMAKAEYTKIRGKSICDTDGTGGPSGGI